MKLVRTVVGVVTGLVILALLAACGTAPTPVPVVTYHSVVVTPPKSLMPHCVTTPPPSLFMFAPLVASAKLAAMSDNDSAQMENIKTCNDGIDALQSWIDKNIGVYATDPTTTFVGQAPAQIIPIGTSAGNTALGNIPVGSTPLGSAAAIQ